MTGVTKEIAQRKLGQVFIDKEPVENYMQAVPQPKQIPLFTYGGRVVNLADLQVSDIKLSHIAHGLSNLCRYNGQCARYYSVAEHSVRLALYAMKQHEGSYGHELAKYLLLHDATEIYVGDIVFHLKTEFPAFIELEDKIAKQIALKFSIPEMDNEMKANAKHLERAVCFDEMYILFGQVDPWFLENKVQPLGLEKLLISPEDKFGWTPEEAKQKFLAVALTLGITDKV